LSTAWKNWHLSKEGTVEPEVNGLDRLFSGTNAKKILDIGCGAGRHVVYFARKGFEVYGFDGDEETLERAKKLLENENLRADLRVWDMTKQLPYRDAFFDAVLAVRVIHHTRLSNITAIMNEINRLLKTDGFLFLQVPSYESETFDSGTIWAEPGTLIARGGSEKGVPHHFFRKDELLGFFSSYTVIELHSKSDHYVGYCLIAQKGKR